LGPVTHNSAHVNAVKSSRGLRIFKLPSALTTAVVIFCVQACVREHELFGHQKSSPQGGAAGDGAGGAVVEPAPPWRSCLEAANHGESGQPCESEFSCEFVEGCCSLRTYCSLGVLERSLDCNACVPPPCETDVECPQGELCVGAQCLKCPFTGPCRSGWSGVDRNGCFWCVPSNECEDDSACGEGMQCYAGRTCLPGCPNDPMCCHGNVCGLPGCQSVAGADCSIVGCEQGFVCSGETEVASCRCEPTTLLFGCAADAPGNVCTPEK
jgi:hypothetical protein